MINLIARFNARYSIVFNGDIHKIICQTSQALNHPLYITIFFQIPSISQNKKITNFQILLNLTKKFYTKNYNTFHIILIILLKLFFTQSYRYYKKLCHREKRDDRLRNNR